MISRKLAVFAVLFGLFAPAMGFAEATVIDTTAVTGQIDAVETALIAVGGALIALAAVALGFKWIKGMLFS